MVARIEIPPTRIPDAFWLGVISLLVGVTLLAPPLSVLYEMNDESVRTAAPAAENGVLQTLYRVPPLSVDRTTYLAARTAATVAAANALFLCVLGVLMIRSRRLAVRPLGVFAVAQLAFMLAMVVTAHRFAAALDAHTAERAWYLGVPYGSAVRRLAVWAALPGVAYPLLLLYLFFHHRRSNRAIRPM